MVRPLGIREVPAGERARTGISRDHVQVDVTVLVLQEGAVEMVGVEGGPQPVDRPPQLDTQLRPLVRG